MNASVILPITMPDGSQYNAELSLSAVVVSLSPAAPIIPNTAQSSGIMDSKEPWKQEKDAGVNGKTSKITAASNLYDKINSYRIFSAAGTGKPGMRWSNSFVHNSAPTYFCYRGLIKFPDGVANLQQLELDMNQMMADGRNCYLCTQFDSLSGTVQYTTTSNGACHWNNSNIKHDMKNWPADQWIDFAIYTQRDDAGVVTYIGIRFNGKYYPFDPTCKGLSAIKENWTAGVIIPNFQVNLANPKQSDIVVYGKNLEYLYW